MRFIFFVILVSFGAIALAAHHGVSFDFAQAQLPTDRVRVEHGPVLVQQYSPRRTYPPDYPQEREDVRYNNSGDSQFGMYEQTSPDFEWSRLSMAIVMLVGGTVVCRRIFRSGGPRSRPVQLQYRARSDAPAARPRAAPALDRLCPRADCGRSNPPMARFCRRCGAPLNDA